MPPSERTDASGRDDTDVTPTEAADATPPGQADVTAPADADATVPDQADVTAPDGTLIRRWERRPPDAAEAVCFVHGATYGARGAFDPAGFSWLAAVRGSGRAAVAVDVRGYGDSERPPELEAPADEHGPVVRASTAARDVASALEGLGDAYRRVHLVGYSWGTIICGRAIAEQGLDVDSLVQYGPVYRPPETHRDRFSPGDPPAAYRRVTRAEARSRWADQRPDGDVPGDAFEAFWAALVGSGQRVDDESILAPNGTLLDLQAAVDAPPYDAGAVDIPTLVVRGSLDTASTRTDALGLFDALGTDDREYVEVAGGSHFLQYEPRRAVLYDAVRCFQDLVGRE